MWYTKVGYANGRVDKPIAWLKYTKLFADFEHLFLFHCRPRRKTGKSINFPYAPKYTKMGSTSADKTH